MVVTAAVSHLDKSLLNDAAESNMKLQAEPQARKAMQRCNTNQETEGLTRATTNRCEGNEAARQIEGNQDDKVKQRSGGRWSLATGERDRGVLGSAPHVPDGSRAPP
jgi:hypothetical protein